MSVFLMGFFLSAAATETKKSEPNDLPDKEFNSIVASVNGEAITLMDVLPLTKNKEYQFYVAYSGERLKQAIYNLRKKTVDDLIDHKLMQEEYRKQNFKISNRDIERELDAVAEKMGYRSREEWILKLQKEGISFESLKQDVEKNMMVQLMLYRQIVIDGQATPGDLYKYFQEHRKDFSEPEKVGLAMLKISASDGDAAEKSRKISEVLKQDSSRFNEMVKLYAPELGDGSLGEIDRKLLRHEFASVLKKIEQGMVVGPLQMDGNVVWLKVVSHKPAKVADFKTVEQRIRQILSDKRKERVVKEYSRKLREKAVVKYYF